jgi:hypothetical protein
MSDHRIDRRNNRLSLPALIPSQVSALAEPLHRVIIEHAREQGADQRSTGGLARLVPIARARFRSRRRPRTPRRLAAERHT